MKKTILHIITRLDPGGSAENTVLSTECVDPNRFHSLVLTGLGVEGNGPPEYYRERLEDRLVIEPSLVRQISPPTDLRALHHLSSHIRRIKPDLIHLHSAKAGALGRVAVRLAGSRAKVVYTPHGHVFSGYGNSLSNRIFTLIEIFLAPAAHAIVGLTADEVREFLRFKAGKPQQFHVIPSGVDIRGIQPASQRRDELRKRLELPSDAFVVGFVGRLTAVKGPDIFLTCAQAIREKDEKIRFLVVGDGDMYSRLAEQADAAGIKNVITWTGWRENAIDLMAALDVLLLTSRNEGQGRVLVEAMAGELPVVAMVTGGVGEVVVDGSTGFTVPFNAVSKVVERVLQLRDDPDLRQRFGTAGYKRASAEFSVEVMISRLEELYAKLLGMYTTQ